MKIQTHPLTISLALLSGLVCVLISACSQVVHGHDGSGSAPLNEVEPNDLPWDTVIFDPLEVGQILDMVGSVQAAPGFDLTDHLGFVAQGPMEVLVTLKGEFAPHDFDLAVWDTITQQYELAWETGQAVETGLFEVHGPGAFQLAIYTPFEDGDWLIRIECFALAGHTPDGTPGSKTGSGARVQPLKAHQPKKKP